MHTCFSSSILNYRIQCVYKLLNYHFFAFCFFTPSPSPAIHRNTIFPGVHAPHLFPFSHSFVAASVSVWIAATLVPLVCIHLTPAAATVPTAFCSFNAEFYLFHCFRDAHQTTCKYAIRICSFHLNWNLLLSSVLDALLF